MEKHCYVHLFSLVSFTQSNVLVIYSFKWLNIISILSSYLHLFLSIYLFLAILVILFTIMDKIALYIHVFSSFWGKLLGVELLGCSLVCVWLYWTLLNNTLRIFVVSHVQQHLLLWPLKIWPFWWVVIASYCEFNLHFPNG